MRRHVFISFCNPGRGPPDILLGSIFNMPRGGLGTLEAGVGALVFVGMAVVDAWAIPWSGCTTPGSISVCIPPGSILVSPSLQELVQKFFIVQEGRYELELGRGKF